MKKKTWLLTIVVIVLVLNITFFIAVRLAKVDKLAQTKITDQLSTMLKADIKVEEFTFNDKQANIKGITISKPGVYELKINQVYIEYNLVKFVFSKFRNFKSIEHIKIYDPEFVLIIKPGNGMGEKREFKIPDLTEFFKILDIFNGTFNLQYISENIEFSHKWSNIELSIINSDKSNVKLSAKSYEASNLLASAKLDKGTIESVKFKVEQFRPDKIEVKHLQALGFYFDAEVNFSENKLNYSTKLSNLKTQLSGREASVDSLNIFGDLEKTYAKFHGAIFDKNKIKGKAEINRLFSDSPTINSEIEIANVFLQNYLEQLNGSANTKINISGKLMDPQINALITSDKLITFDQELTDIKLLAKMKSNKIDLQLEKADWQGNLIKGEGYYIILDEFQFRLFSDDLSWQNGDLLVSGDLNSTITYRDKPDISIELSNLQVKTSSFSLAELNFIATLSGDDFAADLTHPANTIGLACYGNLRTKELKGKLNFRSLDLNSIFAGTVLPIVNGVVNIDANEYIMALDSNIIVYDRNYGKLGGGLKTNIVFDLSNKHSLVNLRTYNARYNYEPFNVNLLAEGSLDSLQIKQFNINKMLNVDGWIKRSPEIEYDLALNGNNIKIRDISEYFVDYYTSQQLEGNLSFTGNVSNSEDGNVEASIQIEKFRMGEMTALDVALELSGNNSMIKIREGSVNIDELKLIDLEGALIRKPNQLITLSGKIDSIQVADILPSLNLKGLVDGGLEFSRSENNNEVQLDIGIINFEINKFKADRLKFDILQKDSLLYVNEIRAYKKGSFDLSANGAIGYNILNSNAFADSHSVKFNFEGDLLSLISSQVKSISGASSETDFVFKVGTRENQIFIENGLFELSNGFIKLAGQPENIDKIIVKFSISDNVLTIDRFKFRMGEGTCTISNAITNQEDQFLLGTMNLGKFLVKTNLSGISLNIPGYIAKNDIAKVVIQGRNNDLFEITGPFDNINLVGDLIVSKTGVIFPPNTENILKLFNKVREKKESESAPLPLSFDIMLRIGDNVKYVTYPVDIKVNPDGYINLIYSEEQFKVQDALFIAEIGTVDIFGTKMRLDYMQIQLSRFTETANISGTFYKKTADGSLITLNIYNEISENDELGTLKFSLNSDNPNDRITDILAKLRYNRSMDEISPDQRKTLLQDEVIQIAGMGLESAVMDPLLSPVENWIRRVTRLDYFHLQTGFVQNLFYSYSSYNNAEYEIPEDATEYDRFSSTLLLNNLSVSMGRYLTRDLFLDYETRIERSQEMAFKSEMGIFHDISLRYQLPYKFRISYKYSILPFAVTNTHEIMLERSFKF
ncbi:MAG: hypothetical protein K9N07_04925 [Candidatus Cloacimonetes bacterium]|nr:hypothetical protein [Candidatus Cloacimonadota bacterium]